LKSLIAAVIFVIVVAVVPAVEGARALETAVVAAAADVVAHSQVDPLTRLSGEAGAPSVGAFQTVILKNVIILFSILAR